jgi:lipopolysaccharide transport system permease protein
MSETLILEAGHATRRYWQDLWRYRELFYVLAWRDMMIRYKQTMVGVLWAFLQPFIPAVITTVIFSRIANLPGIPGVPYFIMVFCGMLPWQFFSGALGAATQSVTGNANLISKVYFPRMIIPAGAVVTCLADFGITLLTLFAAMAWSHVWPTPRILLLPFFIVMMMGAALGPGLLLTALNVRYRDFRLLIPLTMQILMYVTPVMYLSDVMLTRISSWSLVPHWAAKWVHVVYEFNPVAGVIEGFRWSLCGPHAHLKLSYFLVSLASNLFFVWLGISYFRKTERSFADII